MQELYCEALLQVLSSLLLTHENNIFTQFADKSVHTLLNFKEIYSIIVQVKVLQSLHAAMHFNKSHSRG